MKWWGTYTIPTDRWAHWRIGPLSLYARPDDRNWHLAYRQHSDALDDSLAIDVPASSEPDPKIYTYSRYASEDSGSELELKPCLGDRPFIVSPEQPLYVLAGETSVLYVSTIVWVQVQIANDGGKVLLDIPTIRRSDTWFGSNTREGELCYATKTSARTNLQSLQPRPHRATTPVEIRNHGSGVLPVEQLRVPVTALSLYTDTDNRLWTDAVCFVREEGDDEATMTTPDPSAHLPGTRTRIEEPRVPVQTGTIVKAFSKLLT